MTPEFDGSETSYTATTSNGSNKITATPEDGDATVTIKVNGAEVENGTAATWQAGANTVSVEVRNGEATTEYTVTVTKE